MDRSLAGRPLFPRIRPWAPSGGARKAKRGKGTGLGAAERLRAVVPLVRSHKWLRMALLSIALAFVLLAGGWFALRSGCGRTHDLSIPSAGVDASKGDEELLRDESRSAC